MNFLIERVGVALMLLLLWRLIAWRAWRFYPAFFWFFVFSILRHQCLIYLKVLLPYNSLAYARWFWYSSLLVDLSRFLVAWEVFRRLLPPRTVAHRVAGILLTLALVGLSIFFLARGSQTINVILDAKLSFSLAAAVWVFITLGIASYYGLTPSLNAWGIAIGTGVLAAFYVVNFASLGIDQSIFGVFGYARALSFEATLLLWLWTLWSFHQAPNSLPPAGPAGSGEFSASAASAGEALRKALGLDKE